MSEKCIATIYKNSFCSLYSKVITNTSLYMTLYFGATEDILVCANCIIINPIKECSLSCGSVSQLQQFLYFYSVSSYDTALLSHALS